MKSKKQNHRKHNRILLGIIVLTVMITTVILYQYSKIEVIQKENKAIYLEKLSEKMATNTAGNVYYVSSNGTSTAGTDINNPMSLAEAKKKTYYGNDKILLKCGDTFYEKISFDIRATDGTLCYIGNYGEGNLPIISGAKIVTKQEVWQLEKSMDNIYKIDLTNLNNFEGIRNDNISSCNIGFIEDENGNIYGNRKENVTSLIQENDFYCDNTSLYIKSKENPVKKMGKIKLATNTALVEMSNNSEINGLQVENTGGHGFVKRDYPLKNVYLHDCIIKDIGGSLQNINSFIRYGNGIEIWCGASNVLIENNIVKNVYDAAITLQGDAGECRDITIKDNILISNCYSFELWGSGETALMDNIDIYNNIMINQGKGWGQKVRPNPYNSADFVLYDYIPEEWNLHIYDNKTYNPTRLYYVLYSTKDKLKEKVKIGNNTVYYPEDVYAVNDIKQSDIGQYLNSEYNIEQNSIFRKLSEKEIDNISNLEIVNSNDYHKIKTYYDTLETEFEYANVANSALEKYTNFKENYGSYIENVPNLRNTISGLENYLYQVLDITTSTTGTSAKEVMQIHYELGNTVIQAYREGKIEQNHDILHAILVKLDIIGREYEKLVILTNASDIPKLEENQEKIVQVTQLLSENQDLGMAYPSAILAKAKEQYEKAYQEKENVAKKVASNICSMNLLSWSENFANMYIDKYIQDNPVTIQFSETSFTNKDVTASLSTSANIRVINNEGNREYVFKKNGSFTFEFQIRGRGYKAPITVNWIDKIPPIIKGVEKNKLYVSQVTPLVEDENLKQVTLLLDGQTVSTYTKGSTIKEEGIYQLVAVDKAGNETKVDFQVVESWETAYKVENNKISNISYQTSKSDFKQKLNIKANYIIKRNGKELQQEARIATGDVLETELGDSYTLIVTGDINKDGDISIIDLVTLRRYLLGITSLTEVEKQAADANNDGNYLSIKDLVRLRILILNKGITN